jgi:dUTP pyrophosphatase
MTMCTRCGFEYKSETGHICSGMVGGYSIAGTLPYGNTNGTFSFIQPSNIEIDSSLTLKIKKHSPLVEFKNIPNGDWQDLSIVEDVELKSGEYKFLSFGFSAQLPNDFEAHVIPRSSTFKKFGIIQANSMGLIDNSYCGDNDIWMFPAYATKDVSLKAGERIAQFRIVQKQPSLRFEFVDSLGNKDRGSFGSTDDKETK